MKLKTLSSIAFAIAFLMAIVLFTNFGRGYISLSNARMIFLIAGAIGLLFNLLSFQSSKHSSTFSFVFWMGAVISFIGFAFRLMHWPFSNFVILGGMIILGLSFILPSKEKEEKPTDILDDF